MRRIIAFFIGLLLSTTASAQLQVKEGSFKEIDGFVNTHQHQSYQYDDNEKPYAVIIVKTENMSEKQRNELYFRGSKGAQTRIEHKVGEVWVYITYATKVITIAHKELSSTDFYFPYDLKPKKGYELTLISKSSSGGFGSLMIKTKPEIGASIQLNGRAIGDTTPYVNKAMGVGHYKIDLTRKGYKKTTASVDIIDGMPSVLEITMERAYGHVNIKSSPSGAKVYIDNMYYGLTPLQINEKVGEHTLSLTKDNCLTVRQTLEIAENENADLNVAMQTEKQVTIRTGKDGKQIYIDGKYAGLTPLTTQMTFEKHTIKAVDNDVEIVKNVRLVLDPEPQTIMMDFYNKITIISDRDGDEVYIDGTNVGTTPYNDRIKCGDHTVLVVGKFRRQKRQVSVETEGEFVYNFNLHTKRTVNRKNRYRFYGNMLFRGWYIGPYVGFNNIIYTGDYIDKIKSGALSFETYPGTDPEFFGFKWENGKNAAYLLNFIYPLDFHLRDNIPALFKNIGVWFKYMRNYNMSVRFTGGVSLEKMVLPWLSVESDMMLYQKRFKFSDFTMDNVLYDHYSENYSIVSVPLMARFNLGGCDNHYQEGGGGFGIGYQWDICYDAISKTQVNGESEVRKNLAEGEDYLRETHSLTFLIWGGYHFDNTGKLYGELRYNYPLENMTPDKDIKFSTLMLTVGWKFNVIGWKWDKWK